MRRQSLSLPKRGEYTANSTQVFGEVGHSFAFATGALEAFANLTYVHVNGGVNELGAVAMTGSMRLDTTYTTLGVHGATALTNTLTARGTLSWRHALGDVTPVAGDFIPRALTAITSSCRTQPPYFALEIIGGDADRKVRLLFDWIDA